MSFNRNWDTAVIIGSGPSLKQWQLEHVYYSEAYVIAVNDNYKVAPWADAIFAGDIQWWYYHKDSVITDKLKGIEYWTLEGVGSHFAKRHESPKLKEVPYTRELGVYNDKIHHGGNSGYNAIQLARLFGAKKIILLGFDHQHTQGLTHWFGDHDKYHFKKNADDVDRWVSNFDNLMSLMTDVDVVNCSLETAITSCRRSDIETELKESYVP